jgi:PleD family two-component response regulator
MLNNNGTDSQRITKMANILVVDDEPSVRLVIRTTLETRQYGVRTAEDGGQALALVDQDRPDLIVLDWMLPDMDGLAVCRALRANPSSAHIPVIFLTAVDDLERKVAGLEAGGDDYMVKPFEPQELLVRVKVQLRKAAERGQINPLTRLPGNLLIEEAIMKRLQEPQARFALLYVDLDEFKAYNDHCGFSWGDRVIQLMADTLERTTHTVGNYDDFVGHVGGDDFIAISTPERAAELCERTVAEFDRRVGELWVSCGFSEGFDAPDRTGQVRHFGPPTLSIGVVTNEYRRFPSYIVLGQVAAQVKKAAKRKTGSGFFIDRRRDVQGDSLA